LHTVTLQFDVPVRKRVEINMEEAPEPESALEMVERLQKIVGAINELSEWMEEENIVEQEGQWYLDQGLEPPG
jgi:hypothetical protein